MARRPRLTDDGLVYHAINRGNNRADVFADDGEREAFLESLGAKARYPFALFGYCLMTNHFHLLLKPAPGQSISRILQSLTVAHTWRHHRRHDPSGHVWQGRFRSPVDPGRRPPAGRAEVHRGQPGPGRDGGRPEGLPLVELRPARAGPGRPAPGPVPRVGAARPDRGGAEAAVATEGARDAEAATS